MCLALSADNEEYVDEEDDDDEAGDDDCPVDKKKTEDITCQFYSETRLSLNKQGLVPGICGMMTSPL